MKHSESLSKLAPALVAASAELKSVTKDRTNPHFKSRYATLDAIVDEVRPVLARHGLAVLQGTTTPHTSEAGTVLAFAVETMLVHTSGEWIASTALMPLAKLDPQGAGAALTYGRRYGLSALLTLATDDDDDGEAAMPRTAPAAKSNRVDAPKAGPVSAAAVPACPKCAGSMWDNRARNAERVAGGQKAGPAFSCKDKQGCGAVIWSSTGVDEPRKSAAKPAAAPAPAGPPDWDAPPPSDDDLGF
jgi:hypothetical protein